MAAKKIGAIIALDGEREYKQAVTSCKKTLSQLKAEMELVKAETEGQEDILDSLGKKHEVLSKILDAQKQKQQEVARGLDHAKESYTEMGEKIKSLRDTLEQATKKLKDMEEAGNSSEEELKQQMAALQCELAQEMKDSVEAYIDCTDGATIKITFKPQKGRRSADWERLKEDYPDAYAHCVNEPAEGARPMRIKYM